MKALLCYQNQSITVDINDTLAYLSMMVDITHYDRYNQDLIDRAELHVRDMYIEIAQKLFNPAINYAVFSRLECDDENVIDVLTFNVK